ncbi:MAG: DUF3179 domain-containing protein [Acidobacteria bacterium]|nr:DUF3179 domain-containing protein [Acidobacteriota bacterium]
MYARQVAERTLTFGVSGMLYKDGLVMYDRQTDTLWTQVDGRAVRGALANRQLEIVPAVHATWKEWLALYPRSRVLKKPGKFRSPYEDYNRNPRQLGIVGRRNADDRLAGKERVLGIRVGHAALAFPLDAVREARLVQAEVGGLPVLLVAPAPDRPVLAYERRARSRELTFRLDTTGRQPVLRDTETNSTWDVTTGEATSGAMAGARLNRATAYPAFWFGWRGYFPATGVWRRAPAGR